MEKYVFKPYLNSFPKLFEKEKARISSCLEYAVAIEHVGSTAVPGLGGKGIIDIAIAVDKEHMESASIQLRQLGYEFRPTFSSPDWFYFIAWLPDLEKEKRRYHIHLTFLQNKKWQDLLAFRNHLRSHPKDVREYEEIKKKAALKAQGDGKKYRELKAPIFSKFLSLP